MRQVVSKRFDQAVLCGARIRALRRAQHLTLKQLAVRVGLSFQYVANIEKGEVNTPIETLRHLATALEVPISELFVEAPGERQILQPYAQQVRQACSALRTATGIVTQLEELLGGEDVDAAPPVIVARLLTGVYDWPHHGVSSLYR